MRFEIPDFPGYPAACFENYMHFNPCCLVVGRHSFCMVFGMTDVVAAMVPVVVAVLMAGLGVSAYRNRTR